MAKKRWSLTASMSNSPFITIPARQGEAVLRKRPGGRPEESKASMQPEMLEHPIGSCTQVTRLMNPCKTRTRGSSSLRLQNHLVLSLSGLH